MGRKSREKRERANPKRPSPEESSYAPGIHRADETAPWTHIDRKFFLEHPETTHYYRPLMVDEEISLQANLGAQKIWKLLDQSFPGQIQLCVINLPGKGRIRLPCVPRNGQMCVLPTESAYVQIGVDGLPELCPLTEKDIATVIQQVVLTAADASAEGKYLNPHLDFCEICGEENPLGNVEFIFASGNYCCPKCARARVLSGEQLTHIGMHFPDAPPESWPPELKEKIAEGAAFIKDIQRLWGAPQNYAEQQAMKAVSTMKWPPHSN